MKVLVTGASGFLGGYASEALAGAGHAVRALVRPSSTTTLLQTLAGVELCEGSVGDVASLARAMEGVDAVLHCAGLVKARSKDEMFATNAGGTANVVDAAKQHAGVRRFVYVSSLAAAGPSPDGAPLPCTCTPRPVTDYGRSKRAAEEAVLAAKDALDVVILRPPLIYGPRDDKTLSFFQSIARGVLPVLGDGKNTVSLVYATDIAAACVRALAADVASGATYFVDDGVPRVWRDALEDIERAVGKRARLRGGLPAGVMLPIALLGEAYGKITNTAVMLTRDKLHELRQRHWTCNSDDTRRDLAWAPAVSWADGTARAARWYRDSGWL